MLPEEEECMADEGDLVHVESQSTAGKWILTLLAVLVVAGLAYAHYATHVQMGKLADQLSASQAQVGQLQARIQNDEAQQETLARQAGMTKKELAQRTAQLQAEQKASESRLEKEQKAQITQVSVDIPGVRTD